MQDRRQTTRDKVLYGGVAKSGETGAARNCVVRNISEKGASIQFSNVVQFPMERLSLTIAHKGRSFLANVIWLRENFAGVAFSDEPSDQRSAVADSDLDERLRNSEMKKRKLQRRIKQLLGEG